MSCTWRPEIRETIMMISMYRAKPASPEGAEGHHHLQTVSPRLLSGVFKSIAVLHTHTISTCLKLLLLSDDAQWNFRGDKWQCDPNFMGHWWWSSSLETTCVRSSFLVTINPAFFINTPSYYTPLWTWKNLEFLIGNCRAWKLAKKEEMTLQILFWS